MIEHTAKINGLLKVGELARQADTSLSTVKFYVKEGLIRPSLKTGRNMAYYDPSCVETIKLIRTLQRERYYPLSVIKHLLQSATQEQLSLLDAIHKVDPTVSGTRYTAAEAARRSGLTADEIVSLHRAGLITPEGAGRRQTYGQEDLSVMGLVRRRMDAGIPFQQSVRAFTIYDRALQEAAKADVDAFTVGAMMVQGFDAEQGARMIRVSDETLDAFVELKRRAFNRRYGSGRLEDLDRFAKNLRSALSRAVAVLDSLGRQQAAGLCRAALKGEKTGVSALDETAAAYGCLEKSGGDIAGSIAACVRGRAFFSRLRPETVEGAESAAWVMKLSFLTLAPEILGCQDWAAESLSALRDKDPTLAAALPALWNHEEESL